MTINLLRIEGGYTFEMDKKGLQSQLSTIAKKKIDDFEALPEGFYDLTPDDPIFYGQKHELIVFPNGEGVYRHMGGESKSVGEAIKNERTDRLGTSGTINLPQQEFAISVYSKIPDTNDIKLYNLVLFSDGPNPPKE